MRGKRETWIAVVFLGLALPWTRGMNVDMNEPWPVERIVENLEQRLKADPSDVDVLYTLGRTHAFAFAIESSTLRYWAFGEPVHASIKGLEEQQRDRGLATMRPRPSPSELLAHLASAVQCLTRVAALAPDEPEHHLTLAWILETGAHLADRFDVLEVLGLPEPELSTEESAALAQRLAELRGADTSKGEAALATLLEPEWRERAAVLLSAQRVSSNAAAQARITRFFERCWIERAIEQYRSSFELAAVREFTGGRFVPHFGALVSKEAGPAFLRLVRARGVRKDEETVVAAVETRLVEMGKADEQTMVTPIVLSLDGCKSLDELITPDLAVPFDLDGDALDEPWPWLAPGAGWLVWDPERRGEITSGTQLFGSASGWLFFEDGYRVLDALDDDRDGKLEGSELDGISVWFDRNTNGVSERGEVVPVAELGIVALSTHSTLTIGASPANLCGAEMADGRVLPTYDWVLAPVSE